jgi:hypothetical protein
LFKIEKEINEKREEYYSDGRNQTGSASICGIYRFSNDKFSVKNYYQFLSIPRICLNKTFAIMPVRRDSVSLYD